MKDIFININRLPPELKRYIYAYIPDTVKVYLTKKNYNNLYYNSIFCKIKNNITYARKLISYNLYFPFSMFIFHSEKILHKKRRIIFIKNKYNSLYDLLLHLCIKYQSSRCRNILRLIN
jgi:hypothetical protein